MLDKNLLMSLIFKMNDEQIKKNEDNFIIKLYCKFCVAYNKKPASQAAAGEAGEVVCDPFMGAGSVGWGNDLSAAAHTLSQERLLEAESAILDR
jgi:hypothetical protein